MVSEEVVVEIIVLDNSIKAVDKVVVNSEIEIKVKIDPVNKINSNSSRLCVARAAI
jgi:hypothetical protein